MTDKEALKLALEVMHNQGDVGVDEWIAAEAAIKQRLAAPVQSAERGEPEPVANLWKCLGRWSVYLIDNGAQAECAPPSWLVDAVKKATTPLAKQRQWVGLTDEEVINVMPDDNIPMSLGEAFSKFAELLEAKLKEKNGL